MIGLLMFMITKGEYYMQDILEKLITAGFKPITRECTGVYDAFIKVKYGPDPHDLGWVYMKNDNVILSHIKDEEFKDIDAFIQKLMQLAY